MSARAIPASIRPALSLDWIIQNTLLVKLAWVLFVLLSFCYSVAAAQYAWSAFSTWVEKWVYVILNFGSFVLGVGAAFFIFWPKPKSWAAIMASLMLVTFTSTGAGFEFWYWLGTGHLSAAEVYVRGYYEISVFLDVSYTALLTAALVYVLLTFPAGKFASMGARQFFALVVVGGIMWIASAALAGMLDYFTQSGGKISLLLYDSTHTLKALILIPPAIWQIYSAFKIKDPAGRQQIKWIVVSLTGMTLLFAVIWLFKPSGMPSLGLFLVTLIFTYAFIISFLIAIKRYRLWDIDLLFYKTLVYGPLTIILPALGAGGAALAEKFMKDASTQSAQAYPLWIFAAVVLFGKSAEKSAQGLVDRLFKPEEVDFSGTIVEFSPEAQLELSCGNILKILARQVSEQMDVSEAEIYLKRENGELVLAEPASAGEARPALGLSTAERGKLEKGGAVTPSGPSRFSLYIPLTVKRASRCDFLGVLALGSRLSGAGYSTLVLHGLQKLGAEAGRMIYLAKLRESSAEDILDRIGSARAGSPVLTTETS